MKNPLSHELVELLTELMPPQKTYRPMVTAEAQAQRLSALDLAIRDESFYLVFNLLTAEFDQVNGVDKWLGYPCKGFTVGNYLNIIEPKQIILHNMIAQSMYKILCCGTFKLQFSGQRYISRIGLRHYNGEYIEFKKTTSIFQYDDQNRLLAQLNEFTKIGTYEGGALDTRITETDGIQQKKQFEQIVFEETLKSFMQKKYFSSREIEILQVYANGQKTGTREIAKSLNLAAATINEFNKRILQKARETFTHQFNTAREVGLYLKKEKLF